MRLLVVEDDETILKNLDTLLTHASYAVDCAVTLEEGINKALSGEHDLCIVDWMLPDGDGTTLVKTLREHEINIPVLLLTAKSQHEDVIMGLNSGADDYVSKPYHSDVLLARIRAMLRRQSTIIAPILQAGNVSLDSNTRVVMMNKGVIPLTAREYALFEYLIRNKNIACSRADLYAHVWDESANMFSNNVDVYIRFLRLKLGKKSTAVITTIKGFGYKLCDP